MMMMVKLWGEEIPDVPNDIVERAAAVSHARDALKKTMAMQPAITKAAHSMELELRRVLLMERTSNLQSMP